MDIIQNFVINVSSMNKYFILSSIYSGYILLNLTEEVYKRFKNLNIKIKNKKISIQKELSGYISVIICYILFSYMLLFKLIYFFLFKNFLFNIKEILLTMIILNISELIIIISLKMKYISENLKFR